MPVTKVIARAGLIVTLEDCGPTKIQVTSHSIVDLKTTASNEEIENSRMLKEFLGNGALVAVEKEGEAVLTPPPPRVDIPEMKVGSPHPQAKIHLEDERRPEGGLPAPAVSAEVSEEDQERIRRGARVQQQAVAHAAEPPTDRTPAESPAAIPKMRTSVQGVEVTPGYEFKAPKAAALAAKKVADDTVVMKKGEKKPSADSKKKFEEKGSKPKAKR